MASNTTIDWDHDLIVYPLQQILINGVVNSIGYGCFLILAIITQFILIHRGIPTLTSRRVLSAAVLVFFICSTIQCGAQITFDWWNIALGPNDDNQKAVSLVDRMRILCLIVTRIIYVLNDSIVVWRAWVIGNKIFIRLSLASFMVASAACAIAEAVLASNDKEFGTKKRTSSLILFLPLILTNLIATLVILHQTWIYRTQIKMVLPQRGRRPQIECILLLLVESGFIYCGLWAFFMISEFTTSFPQMGYLAIGALMPYVAATYPLLIILVVERQKSIDDLNSATSAVQSIQFARRRPTHASHCVSIVQSIADHLYWSSRDASYTRNAHDDPLEMHAERSLSRQELEFTLAGEKKV